MTAYRRRSYRSVLTQKDFYKPAPYFNVGFSVADPPQWLRFQEEYPNEILSGTVMPSLPYKKRLPNGQYHSALITVTSIQFGINQLRYGRDYDAHMKPNDHWTIATNLAAVIDCEDYVFTKRMILSSYMPRANLVPIICATTTGVDHMVLGLYADDTMYLLDNIKRYIHPWYQTPHRLKLMLRGKHFHMISAETL